jgi:hypothetical protein
MPEWSQNRWKSARAQQSDLPLNSKVRAFIDVVPQALQLGLLSPEGIDSHRR